ncbi:hypothetical protein JCM24511_07837 [Saitozyma sp. JCM 24511]|nr:hypothetical protein JCM24511_07837 [Saitozyma sp. JCM 24511]
MIKLRAMTSEPKIVNPLPPQRRIVTGHDAKGRSIHASDQEFKTQVITTPVRTVGMQVLWTIDSVPCKNNGEVEPVDAAFVKVSDLSSEKGVVMRCVDFAPGGKAMMHRTSSIDYAICVSGEIHHVVEEGEPVKMKPGDVVIQRGTMHAWSNRSDTWARMHFILIGADPVALNGVRLEAGGYSKEAVTSGGDVSGEAKDH